MSLNFSDFIFLLGGVGGGGEGGKRSQASGRGGPHVRGDEDADGDPGGRAQPSPSAHRQAGSQGPGFSYPLCVRLSEEGLPLSTCMPVSLCPFTSFPLCAHLTLCPNLRFL